MSSTFRITVPTPALPYEIGQHIGIALVEHQGDDADPDTIVECIVREIVDIGNRVGLLLELPEGVELTGLINDQWIQSLVDDVLDSRFG